MPAPDILLRRVLRTIRDALPGPTTASRLKPDPSSWRNAPPDQRAAAYVQYQQTLEQLRRIHVAQKIAPKIVDLLFMFVTSRIGILIAFVVALCLIAFLIMP
jgi:hypothetical protein